MKTFLLASIATTLLATAAGAQPYGRNPPPAAEPYGFIVTGNNTGGVRTVVIPRGATGADTYFSSSAVGGNASRPELAVPNGSAGGGSGGGSR